MLFTSLATGRVCAAEPLALQSPNPENATLVMGGSFSPITLMHLVLMADSLYLHEFARGVFLVADPYKAGAAPAEVSLRLTQVAVENFFEILERRNIPFRDFKVLGPGKVTWISKSGKPVTLEVSDFDIQNHVKDSIDSIRDFSERVGDPRNLYWLSGGDSAASMPRWGTWWREMFARSNMLFIGRQSEKGEPTIDDKKQDPLRGVYPDEFLENYRYEHRDGIHFYFAKSPRTPSIFVLEKQTLAYSSSQARSSLLTMEQEAAQLMLTASVYRTILENGWYETARRYLTRANLEAFLLDETEHIEENTGNAATYAKLVADLVAQCRQLPPVGEEDVRHLFPAQPATPAPGTQHRALKDLRDRLLEGDPQLVVSRASFAQGWGVGGTSLTFNLIRSRMSPYVPLAIRNADDALVEWFDLNLSTNELRGMLSDDALANHLLHAAGGVNGAYANYLLTAAVSRPDSRRRLELFAARRYFSRLASGGIRHEFETTLTPEEKALTQAASRLNKTQDSRRRELVEAWASAFLLLKVKQLHPEWLEDAGFWSEFVSQAAGAYPGQQLKDLDSAQQRALARQLTWLDGWKALPRVPVRFARSATTSWRPSGVATFIHGPLVEAAKGVPSAEGPVFVSRFLDRPSPDRNLVKEMAFFGAEVKRDFALLSRTYQTLSVPAASERDTLVRSVESELEAIDGLSWKFLATKLASKTNVADSALPGYSETLRAYQQAQKKLLTDLARLRLINHVPLNVVPAIAAAEPVGVPERAPDEFLWNELVADILAKYLSANQAAHPGLTVIDCLEKLKTVPYTERRELTLAAIVHQLFGEREGDVLDWMREKYGLLKREPIFRLMRPGQEGSYRSVGDAQFSESPITFPALFDPKEESSLVDLGAYINRKWGGLRRIALPQRILFSDLGTHDTLEALQLRGFRDFYQVNSPYSMRGSKTTLAFEPGRADPLVVFHSFVGQDLYVHKQMQLALEFQGDFARVRALTSTGLKSWDRAKHIVSSKLKELNLPRVDDLVLGYGEAVADMLSKRATLLRDVTVGDFAKMKIFSVTGKNGIARVVAVFTKMEYRYFGRSILPVPEPFMELGADRVLFAGSAGSLERNVPLHGLVLPRTFHSLSEDGRVSPPVPLHNELYDLLPYGVSYAGRHLSVSSPLLESRRLIGRLRDEHQILSIDVEGAQIAELIARFNQTAKKPVRFGAAFLVTDFPAAENEAEAASGGLHNPDFSAKKKAKELYVAALELLWDLPGRFAPSAHTRLITKYFAQRLQSADAAQRQDIANELNARLLSIRRLSEQGGRQSRGLEKGLGDLLGFLAREGVFPQALPAPGALAEPLSASVSDAVRTALMLQSFSRSSTLNSGQAALGVNEPEQNRQNALRGVSAATAFAFEKRHSALTLADFQHAHTLLNTGVLPAADLGGIGKFRYQAIDGTSVTAEQAYAEYVAWLAAAPPTYETVLESFVRLEALHPHKDGNGRLAEWAAHHTALRAGLAPLVFPHRFDIDYILSLRRNGGTSVLSGQYLNGLIRDTKALSNALESRGVVGSHLDGATGEVRLEFKAGTSAALRTLFVSDTRISLERESREIHSTTPPLGAGESALVDIERRQYTAVLRCAARLLSTTPPSAE